MFVDGVCVGGVCVDMKGYVVVAFGEPSNEVSVCDPRMNYDLVQVVATEGYGPGQVMDPRGLCVDHENTLMTTELFTHRIQFFEEK